jgi:hypothetical protein
MKPAGVWVSKAAVGVFLEGEASRQTMPLRAATDGAARQRGIDAAPQRRGDVVEQRGDGAAARRWAPGVLHADAAA